MSFDIFHIYIPKIYPFWQMNSEKEKKIFYQLCLIWLSLCWFSSVNDSQDLYYQKSLGCINDKMPFYLPHVFSENVFSNHSLDWISLHTSQSSHWYPFLLLWVTRSLYKVLAGSGTMCNKVWYKVWQGLVKGGTGFGTRWQGWVQGVKKSGTRCDKA